MLFDISWHFMYGTDLKENFFSLIVRTARNLVYILNLNKASCNIEKMHKDCEIYIEKLSPRDSIEFCAIYHNA